MDRAPAAGHQVHDGEETNQGSANVDEQLHYIGPDDGRHAALEGVHEREQRDDSDGDHISSELPEATEHRSQRSADDDGHGEYADTLGGGAGDQKQPGRQRAQPLSEAALDELVSSVEFAAEILRQQHEADDDAPYEVANHQLEEGEVGVVSEAGHT